MKRAKQPRVLLIGGIRWLQMSKTRRKSLRVAILRLLYNSDMVVVRVGSS